MLIDLSVTLDKKTPNYPGDPTFTISQIQDVKNSSYSLHKYSTGTHAGTHIDSPAHMLTDGKSVNDLKLDSFVGAALCVDAKNGFDIKIIQEIDFARINIILFNTGLYKRYYEPEYFTEFPVMSPEIAEFIVSKNIKLIGLDTCSADNGPDFNIHKIFLGNNVPVIENLTNLDEVTGKEFKLYAFPVKLQADASPVRVVGELLE